jgi:hypothetical protein
MTKPLPENVPRVLDAAMDVVLAYKPKSKTNAAKKRKKRSKKLARDRSSLAHETAYHK